MKTILKVLILLALMVASAVTCHKSISQWDNEFLAYLSLFFFSIFWACILYLTAKNRIVDNCTETIEDQEYTPENVNKP